MSRARKPQPWPPVTCPGVNRVWPAAPPDPAVEARRRGRRFTTKALVAPVLALLLVSMWWPPAAWLAGGWLAVPVAMRLKTNLNRW